MRCCSSSKTMVWASTLVRGVNRDMGSGCQVCRSERRSSERRCRSNQPPVKARRCSFEWPFLLAPYPRWTMPEIERTLRILLADDHVTVRHGLKLLIESQADMNVVAEASDGTTAVQLALELETRCRRD